MVVYQVEVFHTFTENFNPCVWLLMKCKCQSGHLIISIELEGRSTLIWTMSDAFLPKKITSQKQLIAGPRLPNALMCQFCGEVSALCQHIPITPAMGLAVDWSGLLLVLPACKWSLVRIMTSRERWDGVIGGMFSVQCNPLIWNCSGQPLYPEKPYKRDSPIPIHIPIHTQESGPGDRTLYADIPCIWTTL